MRRPLFLCRASSLLIIILALTLPSLAQTTLRVGVFPNPPAFDIADGQPAGFFYELTQELAREYDWKIIYVPGSLEECNERLRYGEIDLLPCTSHNPQRATYMEFNTIPGHTGWGQLYTNQNVRIESILELNNRTIAFVTGNNTGIQFREMLASFNIDYTPVFYATPSELFAQLSAGKADAGVVNNIFGNSVFHRYTLRRTGIIFHPFNLHYVTPKGTHADILAQIDLHLTALKQDQHSVYYKLVDKWFAGQRARSVPARWVIPLILALSGLIVLVTAIALILRHQIRMATQELKKKNSELRTSEERFRTTLHSIGDAVIATDLENKVRHINPVAETLIGHPGGSALGKPLEQVFTIVNASSRQRVESPVVKVLQSGKVVGLANHTVLISADGTEYQIADSGAPIVSSDGTIGGVVLVFRDITGEHTLQEQLRQTQKLESIGNLAGGIAHDFNNMLTGIIGATELLTLRHANNRETLSFLNIIMTAAQSAADLTRKLLAFGRKGKVMNVPVDIHSCIADAISILKHSIDKKITIRVRLDAKNSVITGDSALLQNAIINLGINARDAMPDGGTLSITTSTITIEPNDPSTQGFAIAPGEFIEILVRDTGCGIAPEHQKRIFEPFFTTKEEGKGTGLGLAAVYGTMKDHGGMASVESSPGRGSTFRLLLPIDTPAESSDTSRKTPPLLSHSGSGTVLIIDDEAVVRFSSKAILEHFGYTVICATNGREGLALFTEKRDTIRFVILDMVMPEMDGRETFAAIHALSPSTPVILASGFCRDTDISSMLDNGLSGFIQKPYNQSTLAQFLKEKEL